MTWRNRPIVCVAVLEMTAFDFMACRMAQLYPGIIGQRMLDAGFKMAGKPRPLMSAEALQEMLLSEGSIVWWDTLEGGRIWIQKTEKKVQ